MKTSDNKVLKFITPSNILITKPTGQGEQLQRQLTAVGYNVYHHPLLEIQRVEQSEHLQTIQKNIHQYNLFIFISPNAVKFGIEALPFPKNALYASIGSTTTKTLQHKGYNVSIQPNKNFNSEGLLAHPQLQCVNNKKILIIRGISGRELLANTLQKRGADVSYAEVYQRTLPDTASQLKKRLQCTAIDYIFITSAESCHNLMTQLGPHYLKSLQNITLILSSHRIADIANGYGINKVILKKRIAEPLFQS